MTTTKMATYHNPTDAPIEVSIGNSPGEPPTVYRCSPGGTVEGPANYVEAFKRGGLLQGPAPKAEPVAVAVAADVGKPEPGEPSGPRGALIDDMKGRRRSG